MEGPVERWLAFWASRESVISHWLSRDRPAPADGQPAHPLTAGAELGDAVNQAGSRTGARRTCLQCREADQLTHPPVVTDCDVEHGVQIVLFVRTVPPGDHAVERGRGVFSAPRSILPFVARYMRSVIFLGGV